MLHILPHKPKASVVVKPISRQTLISRVAFALKKLEECPDLVSKSFGLTEITVNKDGESVSNEELQSEITAGFNTNYVDYNSEE